MELQESAKLRQSFATLKSAYLSLPLEIRPKLRATVLLGEMVTLIRLNDMSLNAVWKGGQTGYDIQLVMNGGEKRVEVKTCNIDNTWVKGGRPVGCSGIKPSKFDYLVFVTFSEFVEEVKFYVLTSEETKRFKKVGKNIYRQSGETEDRVLDIGSDDTQPSSLGAWSKMLHP